MGSADTLLSKELGWKTPVLRLEKGLADPLTPKIPWVTVALGFWPLATHLCLVLPLAAEHRAGFQITLFGAVATVLAVVCTAVMVMVTWARKVMTLAAQLSPRPPRPCHSDPFWSPSCPE